MSSADCLAEFEQQRPRLFGLAYRLLGSAHEAEDAVQDAFIRWNGVDRANIDSPSAWLTKVVTNLSLNRLTSARAQRERYVGPWLPEPVIVEPDVLGPLETVEQRESVSFAILVLLERLSPLERAVFVLRAAFAYSHHDIARIVEISEVNCRQVHRRARQRLQVAKPRFSAEQRDQIQLVKRFLAAARTGDLAGLEQTLTAEVSSWADSGGQVSAARRPILGRDRVVRYLAGGVARLPADFDLAVLQVNGEPSVVASVKGAVVGVVVPEIDGDLIRVLRIVVNPDKLRFLASQVASAPAGGAPGHADRALGVRRPDRRLRVAVAAA